MKKILTLVCVCTAVVAAIAAISVFVMRKGRPDMK